MKHYYRFILTLILMVFSNIFVLFAVETSPGEVEFNIRFYDRRIYYVASDPIFVQVTITNNSPAPYRFKLADERAFSVDFDIRTMTNRRLPAADSLVRKRTQSSQIFFREVTIETGESFSFVEDLRDYIAFNQPGSYRLRALVYPELYKSTIVQAIESNYLNLSLRPPVIRGPDGIPLEMDVATGAVLVRQNLPPDQIVAYMLTARQESQWERFFLYMDLEAMLARDALRKRRWQAENEAGRRNMVAEYRKSLQNATVDGDIIVVPNTFEILRTVYNNEAGEVTAMLKFRMPNYTEYRQYKYFLEKQDNYWMVVNYSIEDSGTEPNN